MEMVFYTVLTTLHPLDDTIYYTMFHHRLVEGLWMIVQVMQTFFTIIWMIAQSAKSLFTAIAAGAATMQLFFGGQGVGSVAIEAGEGRGEQEEGVSHPDPKSDLIIGGGDGGVVGEQEDRVQEAGSEASPNPPPYSVSVLAQFLFMMDAHHISAIYLEVSFFQVEGGI
jgi:hypothetical protein